MGAALKHFLERAVADNIAGFDGFFPACFDWVRLCADVPSMTHSSGHDMPLDAGDDHDLERMAGSVFRASHVISLAILSAGADGEGDPQELLDRLTVPPDDDEESRFETLVGEALGAVEESVVAEEPAVELVPSAARARELFETIWPAVRHVLASDEAGLLDRAGPAADVLWGVARVASILAVFRWMGAEEHDPAWPRLAADG